MKKKLLSICIVMLAGIPVLQGQPAFTFGVQAGISMANQCYRFTPIDYTMDTKPLTGPALSLFLETFRGSHFSLQLDLSFACKGSRTDVEGVSVNHLDNDRISVLKGELVSSRFRYLSLAPLARYRVGRGGLIPYVLLGPRMDLLLQYSSDSEYPLEDQHSVVAGLICGAGVEFSRQQKGWFTELQYQPDLSPVTNQEPLLIRNSMLSLTLGIRWLGTD